MIEVVQVALGLAVGAILALAVLRLRRSTVPGHGQIRGRALGLHMRQEPLGRMSEQHRPRMIPLADLLGKPRLLNAFLDGDCEIERVLYSPDAKEQLVRLGVSREHVETVLALPTHTARRSKMSAVQLERAFGSHTLRLQIAEPWPTFGAVYVKQVEWL